MEMHQVRNVSQPSLSRAIKLLEEELGGPLFHRERDSTHLTELGRMVHPYLETVFNQTKMAKQLSQELAQGRNTILRLGIMTTISPDEIIDLIASLRERHPGLELKLCDANARELRAKLLASDLDVVIYALPGEEPDDGIHTIPLFREQMVIVVHRGHHLANARAFPVKALNGEYYIHRMNCVFAGYADNILREQNVVCTPAYWSERDDWTLAMVAAGLGFAFMPANAAKHPSVVAFAGCRARILACGKSRECARVPAFYGRLSRARSRAQKVVRATAARSGQKPHNLPREQGNLMPCQNSPQATHGTICSVPPYSRAAS